MNRSPKNPSRSKSKESSVPNAKTPTPPIPNEPRRKRPTAAAPEPRPAGAGPWVVPTLRAAYLWPGDLPGGVIAFVELGASPAQSDVNSLSQSIHWPSPQIANSSVDGTQDGPNQAVESQTDHGYEIGFRIEIAGDAYLRSRGPTGRD